MKRSASNPNGTAPQLHQSALSLQDILDIKDDGAFSVFTNQLPRLLRMLRNRRQPSTRDNVVEELRPVRQIASLQDILDERSTRIFEAMADELPSILLDLRMAALRPGHVRYIWPIQWRMRGGPSTLTSHSIAPGDAPQ